MADLLLVVTVAQELNRLLMELQNTMLLAAAAVLQTQAARQLEEAA